MLCTSPSSRTNVVGTKHNTGDEDTENEKRIRGNEEIVSLIVSLHGQPKCKNGFASWSVRVSIVSDVIIGILQLGKSIRSRLLSSKCTSSDVKNAVSVTKSKIVVTKKEEKLKINAHKSAVGGQGSIRNG